MPRKLLVSVLVFLAVGAGPALAATLIEATWHGQPVRLVVDKDSRRTLLERGDERFLFDYRAGSVQALHSGEAMRPGIHDDGRPARAFNFKKWSKSGYPVAGFGGAYYVLTIDERICGEALVGVWMGKFTQGGMDALAWLEGLDTARGAALPVDDRACGPLPFSMFTSAGWPLQMGSGSTSYFRTTHMDFGYAPRPGELGEPAADPS
ncbi:MAG: hypothetical protein ACFB3T_06135 [Geminicoccaceae bacterium]